MIVLGVILMLLGYLLGIGIFWTIGVILLVVGAVLLALGHFGGPDRTYGGRRYWY